MFKIFYTLIYERLKAKNNQMQILIITLIILVFIIFLMGNQSVKDDFTIIQLPISSINDDIILEKYPIVISDSIVNIHDMIKKIFAYMYIAKYFPSSENAVEVKNNFTYLIIYALQCTNVKVLHPYKQLNTFIKLYPGNVLILPRKWKYIIENKNNVKLIGLHTLTSMLT